MYIDMDTELDVVVQMYISVYSYTYIDTDLLSTCASANVCIPACACSVHFVHVRARLCMSARACSRERRQWRRNATAGPLDVYHPVCMYMCECVYMHMDVRVDSMPVCARVRTCV